MRRYLLALASICLAISLAETVSAEDVLLDAAAGTFAPCTVQFKGGRPVDGAPEMPETWLIRCWHMKSAARFVVGPDPVTQTNAVGLINESGIPSLVMTRRTPVTLEPDQRYAFSIDYLTTGDGAGRLQFMIPQIRAEELPTTSGKWQRRTIEFEAAGTTVLVFEVRSSTVGEDHALYLRRITLAPVADEEDAAPIE